MYCPKCAAENPETNKYCRACRENLQVVSQAMKSHLPVVIASKIDQILDSRSERFRRDSLLSLLMSLTTLVGGFLIWQSGGSDGLFNPVLFFAMSFFSGWSALHEYRAYRRSLSPDFDWEGPVEESSDTGSERESRRGLTPDFNWRGYDQKEPRDSLAYKLGRFVRRVYRSPSNTVTSGSFSSPGKAPSATGPGESGDRVTSPTYFANAPPPSVTESTTRELDSSRKQARQQSRTLYCPNCGCASDHRAGSCGVCGRSLKGLGMVLELRGHNSRMAKIDRYIRRKNNGLAAAAQNFTLFWALWSVGYAILHLMTRSPLWWCWVASAVVFLVAGSWDRIAYRRSPADQKPVVQMTDPGLRIVDAASRVDIGWQVFSEDGRVLRINETPPTIETAEGRPIREWQRRYPGVWILIEVTSEDEGGVSEGKLIATARDRSAFRKLDESYDERYMVAIYGGS